MKRIFRSACIVTIVTLSGVAVFGQNYKIKQTTSMSGQQMTSSIYVKGSRKRTESSGMMGMGADVATIEQCDLNRTVQVSDKKKMYFIQPNATGGGAKPASAASSSAMAAPKPIRGGTITQISNITDTGERKQMFGLPARHIKTSMSMKSSADACDKSDMSMETDGWYVDLPLFSCPMPVPRDPYSGGRPAKAGCQDTVIVKASGGGKLGFPLEVTQTMHSGDGDDMAFTQTVSTVEFSKATLDDALFNVPADYRLVGSSQELYGRPDFSGMMSGRETDPAPEFGGINSNSKPSGKKPGMVRVGVLMPSNRSGETLSAASLQAYLAGQLTAGKVEGVAVSSEADARAAGCDYVLTSDISKLKQSTAGKIGGVFGRVTGTPTAGTFDAQVDYKLMSLDGKSVLQSKAANKAETDASRAAESVLAMEAHAVIAAAK